MIWLRRSKASLSFDTLAALSEDEWFDAIVRGYAPESSARGVLCGYPKAELQEATVGHSGPPALKFPFRFWLDVRQSCRSLGSALGQSSRILDFGCGWGRITRFFMKDTRPEHITGIDVDPGFVEICRRIMSGGTYRWSPRSPGRRCPRTPSISWWAIPCSHTSQNTRRRRG
jgi:hypothetical protein